jgi:hypothetical protein
MFEKLRFVTGFQTRPRRLLSALESDGLSTSFSDARMKNMSGNSAEDWNFTAAREEEHARDRTLEEFSIANSHYKTRRIGESDL